MNKTIQTLIEAISMIPRQFYANSIEGTSKSLHDRFASQFIVRYRKITGEYCSTELFLPSSVTVQGFAETPEKIGMIRKLMTGISSPDMINPTLIMAQPERIGFLPLKIPIELNTDHKFSRPIFYWNFLKLHFLLDKMTYSCGFYFIVHQDVCSVQKKIKAYYERGLYVSWRAENIYFLIKKDYKSDVIVLNYKGESLI